MTIRPRYFLFTLLLLGIEVLIAVFLHDRIIRPYFGDLLVVILIYCFVRAFIKVTVMQAAVGVLIFSYIIEVAQYFELVRHLGLKKSRLANIVLGNYFEWFDLVAYTLGIAAVLLLEKRNIKAHKPEQQQG